MTHVPSLPCPHCGRELALDPSHAGRQVICPCCRQQFQLPPMAQAVAVAQPVSAAPDEGLPVIDTCGSASGPHVHVHITRERKSVGTALLLTVLFGPFGMFYSTVAGGLVMTLVTFPLAICTFGVSLLVTWPICLAWAAWAAAES